jgi:hypothetical protein
MEVQQPTLQGKAGLLQPGGPLLEPPLEEEALLEPPPEQYPVKQPSVQIPPAHCPDRMQLQLSS